MFLVAKKVKNPPVNAEDPGLNPGSGRSPAEGHGNPLQNSCLENPVDRGALQAAVHGVADSDTTEGILSKQIAHILLRYSQDQFSSVAQSCPTTGIQCIKIIDF